MALSKDGLRDGSGVYTGGIDVRELCLEWKGWKCRQLPADGASVLRLSGSPPETSFFADPAFGQAEAVFCCQGSLHLTLDPDKRLVLCPGQVLFLPAGIKNCRGRFRRKDFQGILISETEEEICAEITALCPGLPAILPDIRHGCKVIHAALWSKDLFQILDQLPEHLQGDYCRLKMLELLYLLHTGMHVTKKATEEDHYYDSYQVQAVERIHDYLAEHLDEHLTIPQLAADFNLSGTILKSCFRQLYGRSVHQYFLERRLDRAAELLATTDRSVIEIAASVGYSSTSQFGIMFKSRYKMTPTQYRKAAKMSVSIPSRPKPIGKPELNLL